MPFTSSRPELDVSPGQLQISRPTDIFKRPFIVEVTGAGFDKLSNTSYFTLRFPRIKKIHQDRTLKDTVGYDELQELAKRAIEPPYGNECEEDNYWFEQLQRADPWSGYRAGSRAIAVMNRSDAAGRLAQGGSPAEEGGTAKPSKRKVSSGSSPGLALPAKRAKMLPTSN